MSTIFRARQDYLVLGFLRTLGNPRLGTENPSIERRTRWGGIVVRHGSL